jgi:hypothetical protein
VLINEFPFLFLKKTHNPSCHAGCSQTTEAHSKTCIQLFGKCNVLKKEQVIVKTENRVFAKLTRFTANMMKRALKLELSCSFSFRKVTLYAVRVSFWSPIVDTFATTSEFSFI